MLFSSLKISASGLTAQRLRMDVISDNIANASTTRTATGGPYRRKKVIFQARDPRIRVPLPFGRYLEIYLGNKKPEDAMRGVRVKAIVEDKSPFRLVYDPTHPDAGPDGYVRYPNVNVVQEMVDLIDATRAYEANVSAVQAAKSMFNSALQIGR